MIALNSSVRASSRMTQSADIATFVETLRIKSTQTYYTNNLITMPIEGVSEESEIETVVRMSAERLLIYSILSG